MRVIWAALVLALVATPAAADPATLIITGLTAAGVTVGAVGAAFIKIGVGLAFSALSSALSRPANANEGPRGVRLQSLTAGEQTPQSFILGTYVSSGNLTAPEMSHGTNGDTAYLTRVVDFSDVQITGLAGLIIDGVACQLGSGGGNLTMTGGDGLTPAVHPTYGPTVNKGDFIGVAWCRFYDGSQTAADSMLRSKYGSYPQRPWTAQMIGRGVAYAALTFFWRDSPQVWQGRPDVKFVLQGIRLYDPRKDSTAGGSGAHRYGTTSTHEFSDNPVVMIYNVLRGIQILGGDLFGGGYAAADLPYSVWAAAMNACDVMVGDRKTYTAGFEVFMGGSEAGGSSPADLVEEMLKTCLAQIADVGGAIYIRVGAPGLPVKFITDDDILVTQAQQLDPFPGAAESYNVVNANWVNPSKLWTVVEATPRRDTNAITADGQELVAQLALGAVTNARQVQQLTAAWLKDARRFRRHSITLAPEGILLKPLDVIDWTSTRNGYVSKQFEISEMGVHPQTLSTTISIREVDPNDYNWTVGDELADSAVSIEPVLPSPLGVPGFTATATTIKDASGVDRLPAILLGWALPLAGVSAVRFQIRVSGSNTVAVEGSTANVDVGYHVVSAGIVGSVDYQARARLVGPKTTEWTAWVTVTAPNVGIKSVDFQGSIQEVFRNAGLAPVEIVTALPTTGNFAGRTVFLTTDFKLYRHAGTPAGSAGFTAAVPAVDVTGQLTDAQIAAIAAAKMTGQITGTQITDGSISTPKLQAGAVTTAALAAGSVTAEDIAAGAVTAGKIAAGAVTAGTLAAGAVTAGTIAANAITAGLIAAGAITTTELIVDGAVSRRVYAQSQSLDGWPSAGSPPITLTQGLQVIATKTFGAGTFADWVGLPGDRRNPIIVNFDSELDIGSGGGSAQHGIQYQFEFNISGSWGAFIQKDFKVPLAIGPGRFQYTKSFVIDSGSWNVVQAVRIRMLKAATSVQITAEGSFMMTQISV